MPLFTFINYLIYGKIEKNAKMAFVNQNKIRTEINYALCGEKFHG